MIWFDVIYSMNVRRHSRYGKLKRIWFCFHAKEKEALCWMNTTNTATWRMYAFSIIVACLHFNDTHGLNGLIIINSIYNIDLNKMNNTNCYRFIIRCNYFGYLSNNLNTSLLQMAFIQILFLSWQKINGL